MILKIKINPKNNEILDKKTAGWEIMWAWLASFGLLSLIKDHNNPFSESLDETSGLSLNAKMS